MIARLNLQEYRLVIARPITLPDVMVERDPSAPDGVRYLNENLVQTAAALARAITDVVAGSLDIPMEDTEGFACDVTGWGHGCGHNGVFVSFCVQGSLHEAALAAVNEIVRRFYAKLGLDLEREKIERDRQIYKSKPWTLEFVPSKRNEPEAILAEACAALSRSAKKLDDAARKMGDQERSTLTGETEQQREFRLSMKRADNT